MLEGAIVNLIIIKRGGCVSDSLGARLSTHLSKFSDAGWSPEGGRDKALLKSGHTTLCHFDIMGMNTKTYGVIHNLRRQRIGREGLAKCLL